VADAAEPIGSGLKVRLQYLAHRRARREIHVAHDAGTCADGSISAACAHCGDAVDEFRFANRLERLRAAGAIHGAALNEHRGANVVSGIEVRQELGQQVARRTAQDRLETVLGHRPPGQQRRRPIP
jgi:hypothetical protein